MNAHDNSQETGADQPLAEIYPHRGWGQTKGLSSDCQRGERLIQSAEEYSQMSTKARATVEDLARAPGKAELVNGEVVLMSPTGALPASAGGRIYISLMAHVDATGVGRALPDNAAFLVDLPHRQSFSPDASFYIGPIPDMDFVPLPPAFAAEVRSKGDYGPRAEREMAEKRADYFAAGTKVVWDVDLLDEAVIRKYLPASPTTPAVVFRRGEIADAEPAVPGWRLPVDDLFR